MTNESIELLQQKFPHLGIEACRCNCRQVSFYYKHDIYSDLVKSLAELGFRINDSSLELTGGSISGLIEEIRKS